jgi:hypothetical protein
MADNVKAPTHTAFAFRREGKKFGRWLEVGTGRVDKDGLVHVFLDRTPIGGFTGYVRLSPIGVAPPLPEPQRPGADEDLD